MFNMYINRDSKVVVQGITGNQGLFHTKLMLEYGTKIVAGVTPKKGGQIVHDIPVFNTVEEAVKDRGQDVHVLAVGQVVKEGQQDDGVNPPENPG